MWVLSGLKPNRLGKVRCPFHDDQVPSLQLYDDGTWYCFGACQAGGSVLDFGARVLGIGTTGLDFLKLCDLLASALLSRVRRPSGWRGVSENRLRGAAPAAH